MGRTTSRAGGRRLASFGRYLATLWDSHVTTPWQAVSEALLGEDAPARRPKPNAVQLEIDRLEERYFPGQTAGMLGWGLIGTGLAFLDRDLLAPPQVGGLGAEGPASRRPPRTDISTSSETAPSVPAWQKTLPAVGSGDPSATHAESTTRGDATAAQASEPSTATTAEPFADPLAGPLVDALTGELLRPKPPPRMPEVDPLRLRPAGEDYGGAAPPSAPTGYAGASGASGGGAGAAVGDSVPVTGNSRAKSATLLADSPFKLSPTAPSAPFPLGSLLPTIPSPLAGASAPPIAGSLGFLPTQQQPSPPLPSAGLQTRPRPALPPQGTTTPSTSPTTKTASQPPASALPTTSPSAPPPSPGIPVSPSAGLPVSPPAYGSQPAKTPAVKHVLPTPTIRPKPFTTSNNSPLSGSASPISAVEGQQWTGILASFTDFDMQGNPDKNVGPDGYGATIDWGDGTHSSGSITTGGNTATVTGTHTYTEEIGSPYAVSITIGDSDDNGNSTLCLQTTATVADAPLTATSMSGPPTFPFAPQLQSGQSYTETIGTFTDADPGVVPSDFTLSNINWGDTTSSGASLTYDSTSHSFYATGTHTYTSPGFYVASVMLQGTETNSASVTAYEGFWVDDGYLLNPQPTTFNVPGGLWAQTGNVQVSQPLDYRLSNSGALDATSGLGGSPALVYNSTSVYAQPIIETILPTTGLPVPSSIVAKLTWNNDSTKTKSVTFGTSGHAPGDTYVLGIQTPAGWAPTTGAYPWQEKIVINTPTTITVVDSGTALVLNNGSSDPLGAGWSLSGLGEIIPDGYDHGVWRLDGQGGASFFLANSSGPVYQSQPGDFGTLEQNGTGYTYIAQDQTKWNYNQSVGGGIYNLTSVVDPHNLALTYTYLGGNLVSTVSAPDGGVTSFSYTGNALTGIVEPGNRVLTLAYSSGNLTSITAADGNTRVFQYDSNHRVTNDRWGILNVTYGYDSTNGELNFVDRGQGATLNFTPRNAQGLATNPAISTAQDVAVYREALGMVVTYTLDPGGRPLKAQSSDGGIQTWTLNNAGQVTASTDVLGRTTSYAYDPNTGDLTQVTYPDGNNAYYQYGAFNHLTQVTDTLGRVTQYGYDPGTGDLTTVTNALNQTTTLAWNNGLLQSVTDPLNHTTAYQLDPSTRRLLSITDPLNNQTTYGYDAAGDVTLVKDALGRVTSSVYDPMSRLVKETNPAGGVLTIAYNAIGEVTSMTDPLGHVMQYGYDVHGWQTTLTQAVGSPVAETTVTAYDALGRTTSVTDANGHATAYGYDITHDLMTVTNALGGMTTYAYDPAGQLTAVTDPLGHATSYAYNSRGWLTKVTDAANQVTSAVYDTEGNLLYVTDPRGLISSYAYDALNRPTTMIQAYGSAVARTIVTAYDAAGNVRSVSDPRGEITSYAYDALNRQTTLIQAYGTPLARAIVTAYDAVGNVQTNTDALGHITSYAYDALNRLTTVVQAYGTSVQRTIVTAYDADSNVRSLTDPLGLVTSYAYDALNRQTSRIEAYGTPLSRTTTSIYDPVGNVVAVTDPLGHVVSYAYDALNRLTTMVEGSGTSLATMVSAYDADGNLRSVTDPVGNITSYAYDALNRQTTMIEAYNTRLSRTTVTAYDPDSNVRSVSDPLGHVVSYGYDALNRQTTMIEAYSTPLARTTATAYDADSNVRSVTDPLSNVTSYAYDALNRQTTMTEASGTSLARTIVTAFDAADNVRSVKDPLGNVTSYGYDALNRPVTMTNALGGVTTTIYDADSNVISVTDPLGHAITYGYDALNRQVSITNALGGVTTMAYDADSNIRSITDPSGHATSYGYDALNRQVTVTNALGGVSTMAYDADSNLTSVTDPLGHASNYGYDVLNRQVTMTNALGGVTTMAYDADSNLTSVTDPLGHAVNYGYDVLNRQVTMTNALGGVTSIAYDADSNVRSVTDPLGHATNYGYDALNRQVTMTNALGGITSTAYDANSNIRSVTDPNGNITSYAYDALNRQTQEIDAYGVPGVQRTFSTAYDAGSNVLSVTDPLSNITSYGYDALNRQTTVIQAFGSTVARTYVTAFDPAGNVTQVTDPNGNLTSYAYDALNRQTAMTEAVGASVARTTATAYDAAGNVRSVTDPRGTITSFAYDPLNRRTQEIDAFGIAGLQRTINITYDAADNVLSVTDPNGNATSYAYDALNRQTAMTEAAGASVAHITATAYDAVGNVRSVTDPRGTITSFVYDALNRQTTIIAASGTPIAATTINAYDPVGNLRSVTDPNGNVTSYAYDALNRQTAMIAAYGTPIAATTATTYDALDNVIKVTNPRGYATQYAYDPLNRLTTITNALSGTTTLGYDPVGNVLRSTDANGHATQYSYDPLNRQISQTDPVGNVTSTTYDANNNVASTIDALGYATQYGYDALNRQITAKDPAGNVTTTAYDPANNVTSVTDPLSHVTQYGYDPLNRQVTMTNALGGVTTTGYDANNNVTSLIDPVGNQTQFAYDALNRLTQQTDPLNHSATFAYDAGGRMTSSTDRNGRQQNFQYDALNRQTTVTWLSAAGVTTDTRVYAFDANNNLTGASNAVGTYTMAYDALDRMSSQQDPHGLVLTFSYDAVGNQTLAQDSFGGVTTSLYDADNRLISRQFGGSGQTPLRIDLGYTARSQLAWEKRYSDLAASQKIGATSYLYDVDMRLSNQQQLSGSGTVLANFTYTYDQASRLSTETDNGVTTSYTYDAVNQLTSDGTRNYSYDLSGNRTGGSNNTGSANQLTTDGAWNFTYDNEGNLTKAVRISDGLTWTYSYDNENHLTGAQQRATDGGTLLQQATYVFDALDNRSEKDLWTSGTTATTRFGYDTSGSALASPLSSAGRGDGGEGTLWADLSGSNALQTRYLHGDAVDQLFARITGGTGGTAAWYLTDRQGSVRNLTDNSGNLQDTITYDPFGNVLSESNSSAGDRFKYTGRELDSETGLQYNRARVYDAVHGRWLSQDPLGFSAGDTNLYRYVGNQPTGATDPSGLARIADPTGSVQPGTDPSLPPTSMPSFDAPNPGVIGSVQQLPSQIAGGLGQALGGLTPAPSPTDTLLPWVYDPNAPPPVYQLLPDSWNSLEPTTYPDIALNNEVGGMSALVRGHLEEQAAARSAPPTAQTLPWIISPNTPPPIYETLPGTESLNGPPPIYQLLSSQQGSGGMSVEERGHLAEQGAAGSGLPTDQTLPWIYDPNAPPPVYRTLPGTEDPNAPPPVYDALAADAGNLSALERARLAEQTAAGSGLPTDHTLPGTIDPNAPPPVYQTLPWTEDPNAPPPIDQAFGDNSTTSPNQDVTKDHRSVYQIGPQGLIDLNPQQPNWAGPAVIDPNAPPEMAVTYGDEEKFPGDPGVPEKRRIDPLDPRQPVPFPTDQLPGGYPNYPGWWQGGTSIPDWEKWARENYGDPTQAPDLFALRLRHYQSIPPEVFAAHAKLVDAIAEAIVFAQTAPLAASMIGEPAAGIILRLRDGLNGLRAGGRTWSIPEVRVLLQRLCNGVRFGGRSAAEGAPGARYPLQLAPGGGRPPNTGAPSSGPVSQLEVGPYADLAARSVGDGLTPDHIPSFAAIRANVERQLGRPLTAAEARALRDQTNAMVIRTQTHRQGSRTYGGRNTPAQIQTDSLDLQAAFQADRAALRQRLIQDGHTPEAIDAAFQKLEQFNRQAGRH
jgi:RHS repeat-associated protein